MHSDTYTHSHPYASIDICILFSVQTYTYDFLDTGADGREWEGGRGTGTALHQNEGVMGAPSQQRVQEQLWVR